MAGYGRAPPPRRLRIPHEVAALVRGLHPVLKRKVRAALEALIRDPYGGKALRNELQGLRSYRVGRFRIVYRLRKDIEVVAFGPRASIYVETYRQLHEPRARYVTGTGPDASRASRAARPGEPIGKTCRAPARRGGASPLAELHPMGRDGKPQGEVIQHLHEAAEQAGVAGNPRAALLEPGDADLSEHEPAERGA